MMELPWLTLIGLVPLLGAVVLFSLPASAEQTGRWIALGSSLGALALAVGATLSFNTASTEQFQLVESHTWIPQFGTSYALGVDGMALAMIVMAAILVPICIVAAWKDVPEGGRRSLRYFAWILVLETMMVGVFAATDVFLFYVFFEAMLIPVYFLIGSYGSGQRSRAAMRFLIFSLAGGLVMLVAVIAVYFQGQGGPQGFLISNLTGLEMDPTVGRMLFVGFFVAFAIKAPMWPVHTWLPTAAESATPVTSVLLVGVLDKVGTYGMIRFCLQLFPEASAWAAPVVITLALVSIFYGALLAIGQDHLLRLVAFTSISHFGFIVMGIFAFTSVAQSGSVLYMVNHGFSTAALFLIVGMLIQRGGSASMRSYGGWQRVTPVLAGCLLVSGLSGLALPGMGSFVSEFLVLMGTFSRYTIAGAIAAVAIVLAALYILLMYQRTMTGPKPDQLPDQVKDLSMRERLVMVPLIASFFVLGVMPGIALQYINPSVSQTMHHVGISDPTPDAPVKVSGK